MPRPTAKQLKAAKEFAATHAVKLTDRQHAKYVQALGELLAAEKAEASEQTAAIAAEWGFRQCEKGVNLTGMFMNLARLRRGEKV